MIPFPDASIIALFMFASGVLVGYALGRRRRRVVAVQLLERQKRGTAAKR